MPCAHNRYGDVFTWLEARQAKPTAHFVVCHNPYFDWYDFAVVYGSFCVDFMIPTDSLRIMNEDFWRKYLASIIREARRLARAKTSESRRGRLRLREEDTHA